MRRAPSSTLLVIVSASLSLFGAGCSKSQTSVTPSLTSQATATAQTTATPSKNPVVVSFGGSQAPDQSTNDELNAILKAFHEVKSFHIHFSLPSTQGSVSSDLIFQRPNRFTGTMQVANQPSTEIIVVENSLYIRTAGSKWYDLSGTSMATQLGTSLQSALNGKTSLDKIGVDPNVNVKKTHDAARNCDAYDAVITATDGQPASLSICATNGLPKFVTITTQQGPFTFEYSDYNKIFDIEKPM